MKEVLAALREFNIYSMMLRVVLAMLMGGIVGFEREKKGRGAGFRTYMLVALGAAMTVMLSQYLDYMLNHAWLETSLRIGIKTDVSRFGAQVINGVGFLGAGTIIVTGRQEVKGLTTAAGLWTSAIIGLVCGAGYVEGAVFATLMVLLAELVLVKLEYRFARKLTDTNLYIEYYKAETIEIIVHNLREHHVKMSGLEISRVTEETGQQRYSAVVSVQASRNGLDTELMKGLQSTPNVISIEEL